MSRPEAAPPTPRARALALHIATNPDCHPPHRRLWAWATLKFASGKPVNHARLRGVA